MGCQKLLQQMIGVTLVPLFLIWCGAPVATPVPKFGKLVGVLVETSTQKPIAAVRLQLTPISRNAEGETTWHFDPNNPRAETDESGNFSFSGVAPGEYSIWAHFTPTTFPSPIIDDSGHTLVFEVKADQVLNVGKVLVPPFP